LRRQGVWGGREGGREGRRRRRWMRMRMGSLIGRRLVGRMERSERKKRYK